jgi:hypothetical protein
MAAATVSVSPTTRSASAQPIQKRAARRACSSSGDSSRCVASFNQTAGRKPPARSPVARHHAEKGARARVIDTIAPKPAANPSVKRSPCIEQSLPYDRDLPPPRPATALFAKTVRFDMKAPFSTVVRRLLVIAALVALVTGAILGLREVAPVLSLGVL